MGVYNSRRLSTRTTLGPFLRLKTLTPAFTFDAPPRAEIPPPPALTRTMSDAQPKSWSDNPNAPKIPYDLYFAEKASLAGTLIAAVLYGMPKIPPHTRPPIRNQFVHSRNSLHAVLPMYGLAP